MDIITKNLTFPVEDFFKEREIKRGRKERRREKERERERSGGEIEIEEKRERNKRGRIEMKEVQYYLSSVPFQTNGFYYIHFTFDFLSCSSLLLSPLSPSLIEFSPISSLPSSPSLQHLPSKFFTDPLFLSQIRKTSLFRSLSLETRTGFSPILLERERNPLLISPPKTKKWDNSSSLSFSFKKTLSSQKRGEEEGEERENEEEKEKEKGRKVKNRERRKEKKEKKNRKRNIAQSFQKKKRSQ